MVNEATSAVTCCYITAARAAASTFTSDNMMEHLNFWNSVSLHLAKSRKNQTCINLLCFLFMKSCYTGQNSGVRAQRKLRASSEPVHAYESL